MLRESKCRRGLPDGKRFDGEEEMSWKEISNIAIICKDYLTVRKCLKGLDIAAEKYGLDHDFKTPISGINVGTVRFTILSSQTIQQQLRGIRWDLVYLDSGIDKDIRDRIIVESQTNAQDTALYETAEYLFYIIAGCFCAYLNFTLYNVTPIMDNLVKYQCVVNRPDVSDPIQLESEYRRISIED
jgi:hypothetical protein